MSAWSTIRQGMRLTPGLTAGLMGTVMLALFATIGRVVVPVVVQNVVDSIMGGADNSQVTLYITLGVIIVLATMVAAYFMNLRLFRVAETALAQLREKAFRHIHSLSMLHQFATQRGALVSRVTGDIDQISQFLQWGGVLLVVSSGQILLATAVMFVYSWQLALIVLGAFLPVMLIVPKIQKKLGAANLRVREHTGTMMAGVSEAVVAAPVVRSYGAEQHTHGQVVENSKRVKKAQVYAHRLGVFASSTSEIALGVATAGVLMVGVWLGVQGSLSVGEITAFMFLVMLFVGPLQFATEVLNEAQNAIAGYRRVLEILEQEPDVADPAGAYSEVKVLPSGELSVEFDQVTFAYAEGEPVLHDISTQIVPGTRVAIVGKTGSGKSTFASLLVRLMDPTLGAVRVGGVDLTRIAFTSLRTRVLLVPQDGFLFDMSVLENVRYGRPDATEAEVRETFEDLGLTDWVEGLAGGIHTPVGERGEMLSVGERQLVALARAQIADVDLLVLDEATSSVDPATEQRLSRALQTLSSGRTTVTIAHRLSTAENADTVLVFDEGRIVQSGPHDLLVREEGSVYARLYDSWTHGAASGAGV